MAQRAATLILVRLTRRPGSLRVAEELRELHRRWLVERNEEHPTRIRRRMTVRIFPGEATLAQARGSADHDDTLGFEPGLDLRELGVAPNEARVRRACSGSCWKAFARARDCSSCHRWVSLPMTSSLALMPARTRSCGFCGPGDRRDGRPLAPGKRLPRPICAVPGRRRIHGELSGGRVSDGAGHAHDAADVRQQRVRQSSL
jgi:hypothetical protein